MAKFAAIIPNVIMREFEELYSNCPEIFEEVVLPWDKPTIINLRAGHIYPQSTLPMGAEVSFDAKDGIKNISVVY